MCILPNVLPEDSCRARGHEMKQFLLVVGTSKHFQIAILEAALFTVAGLQNLILELRFHNSHLNEYTKEEHN